MSRKYELDDIDPDDPAYEMLGSRYSHLVGKDGRQNKPKGRSEGEFQAGGHHDRKHRKHPRDHED